MIEVFATDVQEEKQAEEMVCMLLSYYPGAEINFDLDDCDRILRIKHRYVKAAEVLRLMKGAGFKCAVLD